MRWDLNLSTRSDGVMVSISARQARGPWFDPWWREFSFKFHQSFLISKEKHIAHLKAFKKFASPYFQSPKSFPVPKILSCPQNPFQSSKSLNFMQNETWWQYVQMRESSVQTGKTYIAHKSYKLECLSCFLYMQWMF